MIFAPSMSASLDRLVTSTAEPAVLGSSGRTWAALLAPSASTSTFRSASTDRYIASRSNRLTGISPAGTPRPRSNSPSTTCGSRASPPSSSQAHSCPSGNLALARCAACTASSVFPAPGMPLRTVTAIPSPGSRSEQFGQLGRAPGEVGDRGGQLARGPGQRGAPVG